MYYSYLKKKKINVKQMSYVHLFIFVRNAVFMRWILSVSHLIVDKQFPSRWKKCLYFANDIDIDCVKLWGHYVEWL